MPFWSRFWCLLGPSWPPIWDPFGAKIGSKSLLDASCLPKRQFSKNSGETNRISLFLPPQWLPKTSQNRPKRLPREAFFRLRFRLRFWNDFGPILAPQTPPFGHPFRSQNRSKKRSKIHLQKRWAQERTKTPLGSFWGRFVCLLGCFLGTFWDPNRPKIALGCVLSSKTSFLTKY